MKTIICSATDSNFLPLAREMVRSIRDKPEGADVAIGMYDLDLTPQARDSFAGQVDHFVEPGWEFDITGDSDNEEEAAAWHGYRAMTARPFLPKYFPGHDIYIWIDSDCWVQDWAAIDWLRAAAGSGYLAIVPELDRAYDSMYDGGQRIGWMHKNYARAFGEETGTRFRAHPILNSGVFALAGDSDLWARWAELVEIGFRKARDFYLEQLSMNLLVYQDPSRARFLPSRANWLVNKAPPYYDARTGRFVEPCPPHDPIAILHLSGDSKRRLHDLPVLDDTRRLKTYLRYAGRPGGTE